MTPPHTPDRDGEAETEQRTSVIATTTEKRPVEADDVELTSVNPPPWQRVAQDIAEEQAEETQQVDAAPIEEQDAPAKGRLPDAEVAEVPAPVGEETVRVQRPVVNSTPGQLFEPAPQPVAPVEPATKERTSVRLGGGSVRPVGVAPPSALRRPGRGPRRANLQIKRFDPWSVLKLSLVLGVALFFVWLVAVGVLYAVLDGMGVWDKINSTTTEFFQTGTDSGTAEPLISAGRVFGVAAIIGAVNIVLFSALSTVGAFVYNVSADLAGGIEVTLAERE